MSYTRSNTVWWSMCAFYSFRTRFLIIGIQFEPTWKERNCLIIFVWDIKWYHNRKAWGWGGGSIHQTVSERTVSETETKCFVSTWVNLLVNVQVCWVVLVRENTSTQDLRMTAFMSGNVCLCACDLYNSAYVCMSIYVTTGLLWSRWIWCDIMSTGGSQTQR